MYVHPCHPPIVAQTCRFATLLLVELLAPKKALETFEVPHYGLKRVEDFRKSD